MEYTPDKFTIDDFEKLNQKMEQEIEIWMEGYAVTGNEAPARMIGKGVGFTFDEAVRDYMSRTPDHGVRENVLAQYENEEAYQNRRSNWNIWACNLFDNQADASKSFG